MIIFYSPLSLVLNWTASAFVRTNSKHGSNCFINVQCHQKIRLILWMILCKTILAIDGFEMRLWSPSFFMKWDHGTSLVVLIFLVLSVLVALRFYMPCPCRNAWEDRLPRPTSFMLPFRKLVARTDFFVPVVSVFMGSIYLYANIVDVYRNKSWLAFISMQ